ncbi:MAG: hypothetical protein ACOC56_00630 [Atribacterota bacterium]
MKNLFIHDCIPGPEDVIILPGGNQIALDKICNINVNLMRKNLKFDFYMDTFMQSMFPAGVFRDGNSIECSPIECNVNMHIGIKNLGTLPGKINKIFYHSHKHFYVVSAEASIGQLMLDNYEEPKPKNKDDTSYGSKSYKYIDI